MTDKQLKMLKTINKKPITYNDLAKKLRISDESLNSMFTREIILLLLVEKGDIFTGIISLNDEGQTIVGKTQREQFDKLFNRCLSITAIVISIISLIISSLK